MMRPEIIITTTPQGGVALSNPAAPIMRAMSMGGFWRDCPRGFLDAQIESKIAGGHQPDAARRFCRALAFGGLTDAESLAVLRDLLNGHLGTGHEILDVDEIPSSRWFRDAWRRSHNGGPIHVAMPAARRIQLDRIKKAVAARNAQRTAIGRKPIVPLWAEIGNAIRHARDEAELARVWPAEAKPSIVQPSATLEEASAPAPRRTHLRGVFRPRLDLQCMALRTRLAFPPEPTAPPRTKTPRKSRRENPQKWRVLSGIAHPY